MSFTTSLTLPVRSPFSLSTVINSHGWVQLAPFRWDAQRGVLARPEETTQGPVELRLSAPLGAGEDALRVEVVSEQPLLPATQVELLRRAGRIVCAEQDLDAFHRLCRQDEHLQQAAENGKGRMLRGSHLFEDVVKTILTTNVSWSGTLRMVRRVVEAMGAPLPWEPDWRTFPAPAQMVAAGPLFAEKALGLGYRGPYLLELAQRVAGGELDVVRWEDGSLTSAALYAELRKVKGIGEYAASSLLLLLQRADRVPVDSWARKLIGERFYAGASVTDKQLAAAFEAFGPWRGLAYWFYDWKI